MTDEKKPDSGGNKNKSGKRRYFRRRNKNNQPDKGTEQRSVEGAAAKPAPRNSAPADRKGSPPNKKRRSRRRRSTRREGQSIDSSAPMVREPEPTYEEPISVFVYTHVIRPAYRDMVSDFRSESSFLEDHERESSTFNAGSLLAQEIRDQIERQFRIGDNLPDEPAKKPMIDVSEDWDDEGWKDDDWDDHWDDEPKE